MQMLQPLPMRRVRVHVLREEALAAALALAESNVFSAETLDLPADCLGEYPAADYERIYASARSRFDKLAVRMPPMPMMGNGTPSHPVTKAELDRLNERLGELWRLWSDLEEQRRRLEERQQSIEHLRQSLEKFANLDIDLGVFHRPSRFLALHLGTVPRGNLSHLQRAAALNGQLVTPFHESGDLAYILMAGPKGTQAHLDGLLGTADFRSVTIPEEFHDNPQKVEEQLQARAGEIHRLLADNTERMAGLVKQYSSELVEIGERLFMAAPYAELAPYLRARGGLSVVQGWTPAENIAVLQRHLEERLEHPFLCTAREPTPDEWPRVPSALTYPSSLAPFVLLVRNYGIPRYREFDPTVLFSLTFVLMFGSMFGDVGHGLVMVIAAFLLKRRFGIVFPFLLGAGGASMVFGVLYGSVFGFEHLLHPVWLSPLSDPARMLAMALGWGIVLVFLANLLAAYNLFAGGRLGAALLSANGLAGMLFYLAAVYSGYRWFEQGKLGAGELAAVSGALLAFSMHHWRSQEGPLGERLIVAAIEVFETVIRYLSNTLSFLRVAAFSLNHVALSVTVFALADMTGKLGYWAVVLIGNVFIIILEGIIVTIQVLRLEYYEGFSRFFQGDGRAFHPLRLMRPDLGATSPPSPANGLR